LPIASPCFVLFFTCTKLISPTLITHPSSSLGLPQHPLTSLPLISPTFITHPSLSLTQNPLTHYPLSPLPSSLMTRHPYPHIPSPHYPLSPLPSSLIPRHPYPTSPRLTNPHLSYPHHLSLVIPIPNSPHLTTPRPHLPYPHHSSLVIPNPNSPHLTTPTPTIRLLNFPPLRGRSHMTSSPRGRGVPNDDDWWRRGRGGLANDDVIKNCQIDLRDCIVMLWNMAIYFHYHDLIQEWWNDAPSRNLWP
jgi:hypothetical protein